MGLPLEREIEMIEISTYPVIHLPIIKQYALKLGIIETINQLIPS